MSITKSTIVVYEYSGSTNELTIPFDYLKRDFVVVALGGDGKPQKALKLGTDYRFATKTTIVITRQYQPDEDYTKIIVRRVTDASKRIINYQDGSILNASELNTSQLQALHVAEEARDLSNYTLFVNNDNNLDARGRKIINLADPTESHDAVTKNYVDTASESVIDSRNKTLQYRNDAERFRNEAETFKNTASSKASEIASRIDKADQLNEQALTNSSKAQQYAASAQQSASAASIAEKNAKASDKSSSVNATKAEEAKNETLRIKASHISCASIEDLRTIIPAGANQFVLVKNYYRDSVGGGGLFYYKEDDKSTLDNGATVIVGSNGARWFRQYKDYLTVKDFGAVGDGVSDDTLNIQKAINYCAPYVWKGTVPLTTNQEYKVIPLHFQSGVYRVTSTLLLNKGSVLIGPSTGGYFMDSNMAIIEGDLEGYSYILDTAPYSAEGVRTKNTLFSGSLLDNGKYSSVNNILMQRLCVRAKSGRDVKGCLNLGISGGTIIENCLLKGCDIGITLTGSWSGEFRNNNIISRAIGIQCITDVTTWSIHNNYISKTREEPSSSFEYDIKVGLGKDEPTGIALRYANPILIKNTIEHFSIGITALSCLNLKTLDNYMEGIKTICYKIHSTPAYINVGYTYCAEAMLLKSTGNANSNLVLDFEGCNQVKVLPSLSVSYMPVILRGKEATKIITKSNALVSYELLCNKSMPTTVYVSSEGDDTNTGYSAKAPVKTFTAALFRTTEHSSNVIKIIKGPITTLRYFESKDTVKDPISNRTIEIKPNDSSKQLLRIASLGGIVCGGNFDNVVVTFDNINIEIPTGTQNYKASFRGYNNSIFTFKNCDVTGATPEATGSYLLGSVWNVPVDYTVRCYNSNFTRLSFNYKADKWIPVWTEMSAGCTYTTVEQGDKSGCIFSTKYKGV